MNEPPRWASDPDGAIADKEKEEREVGPYANGCASCVPAVIVGLFTLIFVLTVLRVWSAP